MTLPEATALAVGLIHELSRTRGELAAYRLIAERSAARFHTLWRERRHIESQCRSLRDELRRMRSQNREAA